MPKFSPRNLKSQTSFSVHIPLQILTQRTPALQQKYVNGAQVSSVGWPVPRVSAVAAGNRALTLHSPFRCPTHSTNRPSDAQRSVGLSAVLLTLTGDGAAKSGWSTQQRTTPWFAVETRIRYQQGIHDAYFVENFVFSKHWRKHWIWNAFASSRMTR